MQTLTTAASVTRGGHFKKSIRPRRFELNLILLWYTLAEKRYITSLRIC